MIKYVNRVILVIPFMITLKLWTICDFVAPNATDSFFGLIVGLIAELCEIEIDE